MEKNQQPSENTPYVHMSDMPREWPKSLKQFFIDQPDFNKQLVETVDTQSKTITMLQQSLARLQQRIEALEGKS